MATNKINAGLNALQQGDKEFARQIFAEIVKSDPQNDQAWVLLASCLQDDKQKRYCMDQALKNNPNNLQARQFFDSSVAGGDTTPHKSFFQSDSRQSSSKLSSPRPTNRAKKDGTFFQLLGQNLASAEDETTIRTYHCTRLSSRLLNLKAQGYLVVTNKRVIFHAHGSSYTGSSVLQSEISVEDVSGISHYKGTMFSLSHLLTSLAIIFFYTPFVMSIFGGISAAISSFFYEVSSVLQIGLLILGGVVSIFSFSISSKKIWRLIVLMTSIAILNIAIASGGAGLFGLFLSQGGNAFLETVGAINGVASAIVSVIAGIASFGLAIYSLFCVYTYSQRETVSLAISSKGGSSTPIAISGISGFGHNVAAVKALTAEPAADVDTMIRELGAMITDIQSLGDYGIEKWQKD